MNPVIPSTVGSSAQQPSLHSPAHNNPGTTNAVGSGALSSTNVPVLSQNNNSAAVPNPVATIGSTTPATPSGLLNPMVAPNAPVSLSNITPGIGAGGVPSLNTAGTVGLPTPYPINSNLDVVLPPQQPAKIKKGVKRKADTTTPTATSFDSPYVNTEPKTPKTATRNAGRQVSFFLLVYYSSLFCLLFTLHPT